MKKLLTTLLLAATTFAVAQNVHDSPNTEMRYCGVPFRDKNGDILRSTHTIDAFQKAHPCPSTGKPTGACPGWAVDHVIPLACGGCDAVSNMQWMPNALKSSAGKLAKDRWERSIYADSSVYNGSACKFKVIPN